MAQAVADAIPARAALIAEAGTGTGKTFAYLVPALLYGGKVIVSTGTKTLQDQLFQRDLPLITRRCASVDDRALRDAPTTSPSPPGANRRRAASVARGRSRHLPRVAFRARRSRATVARSPMFPGTHDLADGHVGARQLPGANCAFRRLLRVESPRRAGPTSSSTTICSSPT
jgi:hypothetical protein